MNYEISKVLRNNTNEFQILIMPNDINEEIQIYHKIYKFMYEMIYVICIQFAFIILLKFEIINL